MLWKGIEQLSVKGGRFKINKLLFADGNALFADSEEKFCRLVCECGRVCEKTKLRVNVGMSKDMRYSSYGNEGRMYVTLNLKPFEEVECIKWGSQVAADGGCERNVVHIMNQGYRALGVLKSVLRNRGLRIKAKKGIRRSKCANGVVRSRGKWCEKCLRSFVK